MATEDSGELSLGDGELRYVNPHGRWALKVADIRLIGEITTSEGPWFDDYFCVFSTRFEDGWHEAPMSARGCNDVLVELGGILGAKLESALCNSTQWKTRIMWPEPWKGQELLTAIPAPRKKGVWNRLFGVQIPDTVVPSAGMREVFGTSETGAQRPSAHP